MPVYDIDSHRPSGSFEPDPADGWSVPVGRIAGIRIYLSYSIFIALAVLGALVAMVQNREANRDLPLLAITAIAIWSVGWIVQLIVQIALHFGGGIRSSAITLGVFGIELPNPLRRTHMWSALATLFNCVITIAVLIAFGIGCLAVHLSTNSADLTSWNEWQNALSAPGFSLGELSNVYVTATWLFWIQALCQAFPMPPNLGRGALAATIAMFAAEANELLQTKLLRKSIQLIAIVTLLIAMASMITDGDQFLPKWPVLVLLAVILWISNNHRDLTDWIAAINLAEADSTTDVTPKSRVKLSDHGNRPTISPGQWVADVTDSVRLRKKRKLAKEALRREREEASDQARLDHVLQIVAEQGTDGLSDDDKALLKRVSENLRRQRAAEEQTSPEADDQD